MYSDSQQIKIAAVAAELNYSLPKEIHVYDIMLCARQLVKDFHAIHAAYTDEDRTKLLN
jgi:lipopolysaccharide biosynthesis glycosyltransferase